MGAAPGGNGIPLGDPQFAIGCGKLPFPAAGKGQGDFQAAKGIERGSAAARGVASVMAGTGWLPMKVFPTERNGAVPDCCHSTEMPNTSSRAAAMAPSGQRPDGEERAVPL